MLRWLSEHSAPRAYQRFVITFRDKPAAVANNRGAIANARRHDRLAQHVGKAFAIYRTEREYIDCRINQLIPFLPIIIITNIMTTYDVNYLNARAIDQKEVCRFSSEESKSMRSTVAIFRKPISLRCGSFAASDHRIAEIFIRQTFRKC